MVYEKCVKKKCSQFIRGKETRSTSLCKININVFEKDRKYTGRSSGEKVVEANGEFKWSSGCNKCSRGELAVKRSSWLSITATAQPRKEWFENKVGALEENDRTAILQKYKAGKGEIITGSVLR